MTQFNCVLSEVAPPLFSFVSTLSSPDFLPCPQSLRGKRPWAALALGKGVRVVKLEPLRLESEHHCELTFATSSFSWLGTNICIPCMPCIRYICQLTTMKPIASASPTSELPEGNTKSPLLPSAAETHSDKVISAPKSSQFKLHVGFISPKCLQKGYVHPCQLSLNPLWLMAIKSMGLRSSFI